MKTKNKKTVIGWREFVDFPEWRIKGLRAKIDTGAQSSALHVEDVRELPHNYIEFYVILNKSRARQKIHAKKVKQAHVKSSIAIMEKVMMKKLVLGYQRGESAYDLTDKQYGLFKFLKYFIEKHNRPPFIREIQQALGDKSTKSVVFKLSSLQDKGYIQREKGKHRNLKMLK